MDNEQRKKQTIKCVVWDLDETLWKGVLLENSDIVLRDGIADIVKTLDNRGILQSIASKNEYGPAMDKLKQLGLSEYFIYPQINWNSKSSSIEKISQLINIGIDTIAFIDDQPFEREEVKFSIPQILCIDAADINNLLKMPELIPPFITEDSKKRRLMYLSDIERKKEEEEFTGSKEEFLASLDMFFTISPIGEGDLERAEELTVRTHQMNTTGYTYSYKELDNLRKSDKHKLFISNLDDKFGTYGTIGLTLIECQNNIWTIKLLLMSCRVISRGVGSIFINYIMNLAKEKNACLRAEFVPNDRNRMMYITYKFSGFKEIGQTGDIIILENDLSHIQAYPDYVHLKINS